MCASFLTPILPVGGGRRFRQLSDRSRDPRKPFGGIFEALEHQKHAKYKNVVCNICKPRTLYNGVNHDIYEYIVHIEAIIGPYQSMLHHAPFFFPIYLVVVSSYIPPQHAIIPPKRARGF